MHIVQTVILGAVEGLTEFLPISSTAHLMISSRIMGLANTDFLKTFEIVIQFGAILAVVVLYWNRFRALKTVWTKILAAFVPTGFIGFILHRPIKEYLLESNATAIWALAIGGAFLILFEIFYKERKHSMESLQELSEMSYPKAVAIGLAQAVAIIPGVSRSAATIVAGRSLGMSRAAIVEFSFLLAVPTMLAASGYEIISNTSHMELGQYGYLLLGLAVAFVTARLSIGWFLRYVKTHSFIPFGVYRIVAAFAFIPFL